MLRMIWNYHSKIWRQNIWCLAVRSFCLLAETLSCLLLQLSEVFVRGFFTVMGWTTVTEPPHRAEQKPPVSSKPSVSVRKHPETTNNQHNTAVLQVSAQLLVFYLKTVTFLHFTGLHVSDMLQLLLHKCWIIFHLPDRHSTETPCVSSSVFHSSVCVNVKWIFNIFELLWWKWTSWGFCMGL